MPRDNGKSELARRLLTQAIGTSDRDKGVVIVLAARKSIESIYAVPRGIGERRQPLLRGDVRNYLIAAADQVQFAMQVVRFGFAPNDFALDIQRFRGKRATHSAAATFAMTVENLRSGGRATYLGGSGREWIPAFLTDLIAGTFGRP